MNLKPITAAIIADSQRRSKAMADAAAKETAGLYADFEKEKKRLSDEMHKELEHKKQELELACRSEIKKIYRDAHLCAGSEAMREIIEKAKANIANMSWVDYEKFLGTSYKKTGKCGRVYLNERDLKRIDKSIFKGSELSEKSENITGGFVMDCKEMVYNCSIDSLFEEKSREIETAIEKLFNNAEMGG